MGYLAKNNAYSVLAGAITDVATSVSVQAGQGDRFPVIAAPDYTYITLEDNSGNIEIVKVTARAAASDNMTIVRAQDNTTAKSFASGTIVSLRPTAGIIQQAIQNIVDHIANVIGAHAASAISNTPAGNIAATTVQAALNELDSEKATLAQADVAANTHAATSKATPVDADEIPLIDSAASNALKRLTWANLKATLKAYFDTFYATLTALALKADLASPALTGTPTAPTAAGGTNTTQIATTAFVIANAPAAFPSGTRMSFNQTAAPTGWTKDTTAALDDSIMRIVTGVVGSGGSTAFSAFNGQTSVGATTLSISQMPSHSHTVSTITSGTSQSTSKGSVYTGITSVTSSSQGGGSSHTHSITTAIKYNDFIIASKN